MAGKPEQQKQGSQQGGQQQRDKNFDPNRERSNVGEQTPDQSRRGQGTERSGTTSNPDRINTTPERNPSIERDKSTERGTQRS